MAFHFSSRKAAPAVFALLLGLALWRMPPAYPIDYAQFWAVGHAVRETGVVNAYDSVEMESALPGIREAMPESAAWGAAIGVWREGLQLTGTPLLYSIVSLASGGHFETDLRRFRLISAVAFCAGVCLLGVAVGVPVIVLLAAGGAALFSTPYVIDMACGNTNGIQFLLFALTLLFFNPDDRRHLVFSGFLAALNLMIKPILFPVPLACALALLMRGRVSGARGWAAGFLAGLCVSFAVPWLILGTSCTWFAWARHYVDWYRAIQPTFTDISVHVIGEPNFAFRSVVLIASCAVMAICLVPWSGDGADEHQKRSMMLVLAASPIIFLLGGHLVRFNYYLFCLPAFLALAGGKGSMRYVLFGVVALTCVFSVQQKPTLEYMRGYLGALALFSACLVRARRLLV